MSEEAKKTDDQILDELEEKEAGKETPEDTSTLEKPEDTETKEPEAEGADLEKKGTEGTEGEVPKEFHKHPAWQRIMKERDEARTTLDEVQKKGLSQDEIDEFRKVTSSPTYIRESMKAQGYKDEAIDSKLRELGHEVPVRTGDDLSLITSKLNINPGTLDENSKALIEDYAKISRVILDDWASKNLSKHLRPLAEGLGELSQSASATKLMQAMEGTVKEEGMLDFKKDIEPTLSKFLDENPEATQEDVKREFDALNHSLLIERMKSGEKKKKRDDSKTLLRGNKEGREASGGKVVLGDKKFSDDEILDAVGYRE